MIYAFAGHELDTGRHVLSRGGAAVPVEPLVFDLLCLLARRGGELVTREEIVDALWQGRIVSEAAIASRIAAARKAVGDDGKRQAIIRTVARRGLQLAVTSSRVGPPLLPAPAPGPSRIRYATADDGMRLAYTLSGQGPPVATVSHYMTDIEREAMFPGQHEDYDALRREHTVLRFDQRGAGLSRCELAQVDFGHFAEDMRAVLDAAGLERVAVFSRSGGAFTALNFAARYPERVSRMVILAGYVDGRLRRGSAAGPAGDPIRGMVAEGWQDPRNIFMSAYMTAYYPEGPDEMARSFGSYVQDNVSRETLLAFRDALNAATVADCLPRIDCPVLVIHSRHTKVHPLSEAMKLVAGLRGAELLVLDTANEMPLPGQETWKICMDAILEFLRG